MGDYGYVSIMPAVGAKAKYKTKHAANFSHRHEVSKPYYYSVRLNRLAGKRMFVERELHEGELEKLIEEVK